MRFVFGMVAVAAVLVGIPLLLVTIAGWPLPTYVPKPTDVMTAIEQRNIPSTFVVKALAVLLWFLWAQFAWASLWELAVNARRLGHNRDTVPAPLVHGGVQRGAARFIASLFTATVVTGSSISSLASAVSPPMAVAATTHAAAGLASAPMTHASHFDGYLGEASEALPTWRVSKQDSLWDISQRSLGDGSRVGEILDLNPALTSAYALRAGMVLRLPAGADVPDDRTAPPSAETDSDEYLPSTTVTIVPGDTLWDLSEDRIELTIDGEASPRETLEYLRVVIDANPDVVEDPNLIFPGEQFVLPAIGVPPAPGDEHDSRPVPVDQPAHDEPASEPTTVAHTEEPSTSIAPAPAPAPAPSSASTVAPAEEPAVLAPAVAESKPEARSSQSLIAKLGLSTVLAGGVLALVRRKRIRRGARDHSQLKMLGRLDQVEGLLARRANPTMHETAQALLFEAAAYVAREGLSGAPVAIELSEEDGVELLWDEQNHTCTAPWKVIDNGWSWTAPLDEGVVEVPAGGVEAAAAALVTLGTRDGRMLMVDLEAFGAVTITGDMSMAEALVRSLTLELASGEVLSNAYVSLVGFDMPGVDHLPRVLRRSEDEAIQYLRGATRANRQALADGELPTMFHLRGAAPDGREATVMIVRSTECSRLDRLLEHARPRTGVAVVVLSHESLTETSIVVRADGTGLVHDLGLDFVATGLEASTLDEIAAVFDDIDDIHDDGDEIEVAFELVGPTHTADSDESAEPPHDAQEPVTDTAVRLELIDTEERTTEDDDQPSPDLFVRLIGKPRIDGVSGLSTLATSIVAYLATRSGEVPTDQMMEAVWNGSAIERKTLNNHLSNIRAKLGELLPPISKPTGTLRLDGYTLTDLQLLAQLYERAQSASSGDAMQMLRQGLDLVGGTPFNDSHYEWAQMGQHRAEADYLIERVALDLADLAVEAGDYDAARAAIISGLRGVPMSEALYRARMNVEAASGDLHAVKKAYAELTCLLDNMIAGFEPSDDTTDLFAHLTNRPRSA
jgi:nucleoid-associated protein YgaU/DNA-binding SARP family transcriptional activator